MEIKKTKSKIGFSWISGNKRKVVYLLLLFLFLVNSFVSLTYGYMKYRNGYQLKNVYDMVLNPGSTMVNFVKGKLSDPEVLKIDIKFKDFQKISYKREMAISKSVLETGSEDYVPAEITHNGKKIKTKIRLKGDWASNVTESNKWSYRIKTRGDETILGMKIFSIHHPKERIFLYEWLYHQTLKREGILNLKYDFVNVILNGKDLGIYAIEEHFDKRLIERNKKREGPIIRFKEDIVWNSGNVYPDGVFWNKNYDLENYFGADIDGFRMGKVTKDSNYLLLYKKAAYQLDAFRSGKKRASEVFDPVLMAKYLALSDLFGTWHAHRWHNKRFYYNPISQKLEPIGFDGMAKKITSLVYGHPNLHTVGYILQDSVIFNLYIKELERISDKNYLDTLLFENREGIDDKLSILYSEFYDGGNFDDFQILYNNQDYIRKAISPVKAIQAYFSQWHPDSLNLFIGNIQSLPVEVLSVVLNDTITFNPEKKYLLEPKQNLSPSEYKTYTFMVDDKVDWSDKIIDQLRVEYKIAGSNKLQTEIIYTWNYFDEDLSTADFFSVPSDLRNYDFITVDEQNQSIFLQPGEWVLDNNLIIPPGFTVFADGGLKLNLINSANILSKSPLRFIGSEENQIYIYSGDSTGQGLFITDCNTESKLQYVNFSNLSNPKINEWMLTGSVNFYESDVMILNTSFADNRSEDALNIIRSSFEIWDSKFENTFSDAFDGDFTSGKIHNTVFENCGNDGIDVSGSYISVEGIFVRDVGDKAISIGEDSQLTGSNVKVLNTEIGITSKDLSTIRLSDIELIDTKVGFTAFQKKSEYGPAEINVSSVRFKNVEMPYLIESGSLMIVDQKVVGKSNEKVRDMLYGIKYGKSSK